MKTKAKYAIVPVILSLVFILTNAGFASAVSTIGPNVSTDGNLIVNGTVKFTNGATDKYILKSDTSGNATWVSVLSAMAPIIGVPGGFAPLDSSSLVPMTNLPVGVPDGIATLDGTGKILSSQMPSINIGNVYVVANDTLRDALTAVTGDVAIVTGDNKTYVYDGSNWQEMLTPASPVLSVNGYTGPVVLSKSDIGLTNVTDDAQIAKSIGTAAGDLITFTASGTPDRLGIGTNGQVLTLVSGMPAWQNASSGFTDPMTATGDLIYRGSGGTTNLPIGTAGQVLTVVSGIPTWAAPGLGSGEANTASNTGTVGVGLFKQKTLTDLEFYKINPASNKLSIALNGTDRIDLDINEANLTLSNLGGSLSVAKGGTGDGATPTAGAVAYGTGSAYAFTAVGTTGQVLTSNGGSTPTWTTPTTGLSSLNGLTGGTQTFTTGTTGTAPNWNSATTVHTLNIPMASATGVTAGLLSKTDYDAFNGKESVLTFNSPLSRATNTISITKADATHDGYLSQADWVAFNTKGEGTVTSVGLSLPSIFTVSNSPVIGSGTLTGVLNNQTANMVFAAPDGISGAPVFRALVANDIPNISAAKIDSGTLALARITAGTNGQVLTTTGGVPTWGSVAYTETDPIVKAITGLVKSNGTTISAASAGTDYEAPIAAGTTSQYFRGDKTWQTLDKSAVGLSNVENTALSTWTGSANITTLGTIGTGVWGGTAIPANKGGTGLTAVGSAGQVLTVVAGAPAWAAPTYTETDPIVKAITGLVKSNGTTISAASAGTDYEAPIAAGTTSQYFRGDKTWQTLDKSAVGLSNVENTALSTWTGSANITTLGTIATGVWGGTAIPANKGGTGLTSIGSAGQVLTVVAGAPAWASPTAVAHALTDTNNTVSGLTTGNVLKATGATTYGWSALTKSDVGLSNVANVDTTNASNISSGTLALARITAGTNGQVLTTTGGVPTWGSVAYTETDPIVKAITGLVKSNGTTISAASAGTDYEAPIAAGTTSQYFRGDKTWQTLDKSAVGLSNVENTALSTWTGSANITTLGTIATGVWGGTAIPANKGGTGLTSIGSAGQVLTVVAGAPAWASPTAVAHALTDTNNTVSGLTTGNVLKATGATTYGWSALTKSDVGLSNVANVDTTNASNISSGTLALARITAGTNGQVLTTTGGVPTWGSVAYTETDPIVKAITGLVKSNGTTISAASAGTDYEAPIAAGTTSQYFRGDKTWQTLDKSAVGLSNVENTALSTWTGSANITTLGTIATGVWGGTAIPANKGGTGLTSIGSAGQVLTVVAGAPAWAAPTYTETDPIVKAITGLVKSNGTTISAATAGTDYLASVNASAPFSGAGTTASPLTIDLSSKQAASSSLTSIAGLTWTSGSPLVKMTAAGTFALDTNTYLTSYSETDPLSVLKATYTTAGDLLYGTGAGTYAKLSAGTSGQLLKANGAAAPSWYTITKSDVGLSAVENTALSTWTGSANITTLGTIATGVWGGTAIPANKGGTGLTAVGSAGQVLTVVAGAPAWAAPTYTETDPIVKAITGLVKSNGTTISAATAGTDYLASVNASAPFSGAGTTASPLTIDLSSKQAASSSLTSIAGLTWTSGSPLVKMTAAGTFALDTNTYLTSYSETDPLSVLKATYTTAGDLLYGTGAGTYAKLSAGTSGQLLKANGAAAPSWYTITKSDVGLSAVENTALSTWTGSANITTLGTIATGVWGGTAIPANKGGTGLTSYAAGDIIYASASNTLSALAKSTDGKVLTLVSGLPAWATPSSSGLTSLNGLTGSTQTFANDTNVTITSATTTHTLGWSGQLSIARGGTNSTATPTNGGVSYGTGTAYALTTAGTAGQILQSNGAAAPTWVTLSSPSILTTSISINFASVSDHSCVNSSNITITGAAIGDSVTATPTPMTNGVEDYALNWNSFVSATDTVIVRLCNQNSYGSGSIDLGSQTWRVDVTEH